VQSRRHSVSLREAPSEYVILETGEDAGRSKVRGIKTEGFLSVLAGSGRCWQLPCALKMMSLRYSKSSKPFRLNVFFSMPRLLGS
jgi:hypothetical protein